MAAYRSRIHLVEKTKSATPHVQHAQFEIFEASSSRLRQGANSPLFGERHTKTMAALLLKHLLNHDEDSDPELAHEPPPFYWDENGFLEEYVRSLESCHSAKLRKSIAFTPRAIMGSSCG